MARPSDTTKALIYLLWLGSLLLLVAARPTSNQTAPALRPRQCEFNPTTSRFECDINFPTFNQLLAHYNDARTGHAGRGNFYFWTHPTPNRESVEIEIRDMMVYVAHHRLNAYHLGNGLDPVWYAVQLEHILRNPVGFAGLLPPIDRGDDTRWQDPETAYMGCVSQAFATSAAGTVYLFMPSAEPRWRPDSFWELFELPALTRNAAVDRIVRVDPLCEDPDEGEEIWHRGMEPLGRVDWGESSRVVESTPPFLRWGCGWIMQRYEDGGMYTHLPPR